MASVEQELWNIFTYYTLHGDPLDPEHIRASQFVKLARDCQIVGTTLSEANPPLTEADCNVSFTAEVTQQHKTSAQKGGDRKKMNYNDFLTVLMKMSVKVYPRSKTVDAAFQRLLMDNVLPLASRRAPDTIDMFLENEDVRRLFEYYADALEQIFSFYASSDKRTHAAIAAGNAAAVQGGTGAGLSYTGRAGTRNTKSVNSMKEALGYKEFLKFCKDFDLSDSVILSTIELGDVYLSSIKTLEPESTIRKLSFLEFWECLVRCAMVAYSKISDTTVLDKIRGLFLYMWRSINKSVPKAFTDRRNVSTYAGDLLSGAMLFNKRFTAAWQADGYRDYLSPDTRVLESGKTVLSRLLKQGTPTGQQLHVAAGMSGGWAMEPSGSSLPTGALHGGSGAGAAGGGQYGQEEGYAGMGYGGAGGAGGGGAGGYGY